MIISEKFRFIFIEVPKTASSSMSNVFVKYQDVEHLYIKHAIARDAKAYVQEKFGEEKWDTFLSFAVIREPCDWLLSWYKSGRENAITGVRGPNWGNRVDDITFDAFVDEVLAFQTRKKSETRQPNNYNGIGYQCNRICMVGEDRPKPLVKRILCYDFLEDEFKSLVTELGLEDDAFLPRRNVSNFQPATLDISNETRCKIEDHWHYDVDLYQSGLHEARRRYSIET